jgi:hypothetical protein
MSTDISNKQQQLEIMTFEGDEDNESLEGITSDNFESSVNNSEQKKE